MRTSALLASVLAVSALTVDIALAHTEVKSTSPAAGSTAKTSLGSVKVTFEGPILSGTLRVKKVHGGKVSIGRGKRDPNNVSRLRVRLRDSLSAGRYKARWTAVGPDGHELSGSFRFKLRN